MWLRCDAGARTRAVGKLVGDVADIVQEVELLLWAEEVGGEEVDRVLLASLGGLNEEEERRGEGTVGR